jgi:hypothetical protein
MILSTKLDLVCKNKQQIKLKQVLLRKSINTIYCVFFMKFENE